MKLDENNSEINHMVLRTKQGYKHYMCPCYQGQIMTIDKPVPVDISFICFENTQAAYDYGWRFLNNKWVCRNCVAKLASGELDEI